MDFRSLNKQIQVIDQLIEAPEYQGFRANRITEKNYRHCIQLLCERGVNESSMDIEYERFTPLTSNIFFHNFILSRSSKRVCNLYFHLYSQLVNYVALSCTLKEGR